jgi:hypothetical protein
MSGTLSLGCAMTYSVAKIFRKTSAPINRKNSRYKTGMSRKDIILLSNCIDIAVLSAVAKNLVMARNDGSDYPGSQVAAVSDTGRRYAKRSKASMHDWFSSA